MAQSAPQHSAELRILDGNLQPLPSDFLILRDSNGNVIPITPASEVEGGVVLSNIGRKLTLEFAQKGLKQSSINLVLLDEPQVYVRMIVDPGTGSVKEIYQKPYVRNLRNKIRQHPSGQIGLGGAPANDLCANAIAIGEGVTAYDTTGAATDGPANGCGSGSQVNNDIWFDFTAPGNGTLTISTCNDAAYDTTLAIYDGLTCPPAAPLSCNDDFGGCAGFSSETSSPVVSGQHYLLRVGGFGAGSFGTGNLTVSFTGGGGGGVPDECADAVSVDCDGSATVDSTTATTNVTDPAFSCRFGGAGQGFGTVWFSFVASGSDATLSTQNSVVSDTMMALYSGACGALVEVACNDDAGGTLRSDIATNALVDGTTYYVQVAGFGAGNIGEITLDITCGGGGDNNDECANATLIECGATATFDNTFYTTDPMDPEYSCRFNAPGQGIGTGWFKFVATHTSAFIDTNLSLAADTMLAVYDGSCGGFTELECNDDAQGLLSEFCVEGLTVDNTYYIQASSFDDAGRGSITVSVACPCPLPPENDDCENAIALALPASVNVDNSFANDFGGVPCGVASGPFKNVWYSVAGTGTTLTATTCNAGTAVTDTKISVFCGDCGDLVCVGGNDDDCDDFQIFSSTVSWCSQVGANYLVTVGNFSGTTTPGNINLEVFDTFSNCVADVVCLPQGACCLSDGSCVITTNDDCVARGGVYQGDGTECSSNALSDGSFEAGAFGGVWTEASTNFGTPLCDTGSCGAGGSATPSNSGSWWCWFGGVGAFEVGSVEQLVNIPANATSLDFYIEIPVSSGNGTDFVRALIDGNTLFSALEDDATYAGDGYQLVSIPLGAFADGGAHTVRFESEQSGAPGITNFFIDDVSISTQVVSCEQCYTLDFETEDDFATALANGQSISSPDENGVLVDINGAGANLGAAAFDSAVGGANDPSQDTDLLVDRGNILILQSNTASGMTGDIFNNPNDDEDGGTVTFDFVSAVEAVSLVLIDIDEGADEATTVVLTDINGNTRTYTVPAEWTEDILINGGTGWRTLDLATLAPQAGFASVATAAEDAGYDGTQVVQIAVSLGSSGGIDDVMFCD